jgi:hypothetical protein
LRDGGHVRLPEKNRNRTTDLEAATTSVVAPGTAEQLARSAMTRRPSAVSFAIYLRSTT